MGDLSEEEDPELEEFADQIIQKEMRKLQGNKNLDEEDLSESELEGLSREDSDGSGFFEGEELSEVEVE